MMVAPKYPDSSVEEYLKGEINSEVKREFVDGAIYAKAETTNRHNGVASNALGALGSYLRGKPCRAFNSDTKVRIELASQTRFYDPDAMVVCEGNRRVSVILCK